MRKGQALVIVSVLIMAAFVLLAVVLDSARLWFEQARLQRSAQSAANAAIGYVAEQMVTLAVPRQTQAAGLPPCSADAPFGSDFGACTATPEPDAIESWLTDADRQHLVADEISATAITTAEDYARLGGVSVDSEAIELMLVEYPFDYSLDADNLAVRIFIRQSTAILLAGVLDRNWTSVEAESQSQIPQR